MWRLKTLSKIETAPIHRIFLAFVIQQRQVFHGRGPLALCITVDVSTLSNFVSYHILEAKMQTRRQKCKVLSEPTLITHIMKGRR